MHPRIRPPTPLGGDHASRINRSIKPRRLTIARILPAEDFGVLFTVRIKYDGGG